VEGDADLVARARAYAVAAHHGQVRRYTGAPYIVHPARVAAAVAGETTDPAVVAAAWLHDVLEDTGTRPEELGALFGERVAGLVVELTNVYTAAHYPNHNRASRKALERARWAAASREARLIKQADALDNLATIELHDPAFAAVYRAEVAALLAMPR
jgi:(p)ppGpp synthase/HD superfamily hydrolase